jgi:hypothetical protein
MQGANGPELERLVALYAGQAGPSTAPDTVQKRFKSFPPVRVSPQCVSDALCALMGHLCGG